MMKNEKFGKLKIYRGVTIVELIVYIGLLSVFMLVLLDVFVSILNARLESESTSALSQDTRYILTKMSNDVVNADAMSIPVNLGDTGSTLRVTTGGTVDTYSLDGSGNLVLNNGTATMKLNGNDTTVTSLSFTKIGNSGLGNKPTVKVSFTVKSLIVQQSGQASQTIETTLGLR